MSEYIEGVTPSVGEAGLCRVYGGAWFKFWDGTGTDRRSSAQPNLEEVQRPQAKLSAALADLAENSPMIFRDARGLLASTRQRIERRPAVAALREHDPRDGLLVEPTPITIRQPRIMWGL